MRLQEIKKEFLGDLVNQIEKQYNLLCSLIKNNSWQFQSITKALRKLNNIWFNNKYLILNLQLGITKLKTITHINWIN